MLNQTQHIMKALFLLFLMLPLGVVFSQEPEISSDNIHKSYALFFVVNDYHDSELADLSSAIGNVKKLASTLEERFGFLVEVVENPTLDEVEQKLDLYSNRFFGKELDTEGQLLIYFSGQGLKEFDNGYWMPADANPNSPHRTGFAYDIWRPRIDAINCKHILVAIDAGHSYTFDPDWKNRAGGKPGRPGETALTDIQIMLGRYKKYTSRLFISSNGKEGESPDQSTFSQQLLKGLESDISPTEYLDYYALFSLYLEKAIPIAANGAFGKDEAGSNFMFFGKKFEPSKFTRTNTTETKGNNVSPNKDFQDWQFAKSLNTADAYKQYLKEHPNGAFVELAEVALKEVKAAAKATLSVATDPNGITYKTLELNGKIWLAENMNYQIWGKSWCYGNDPANCRAYGQLYTWEGAKMACKALGSGWRLPTDAEWNALREMYGGKKKAFRALIEGGSSGFNAKRGGTRVELGNRFAGVRFEGGYWSSTEYKDPMEYLTNIMRVRTYHFTNYGNLRRFQSAKLDGASCRCVKD